MLAEKLKRLRLRRNLLQKDLVDYLNVAKSTYSQYESGISVPDYEILKKLAQFYNVSLDYLLENEVGKPNYDHDGTKEKLKRELGEGIEIHFSDATDITDEEIAIIKNIIELSRKNREKK